MDETESETGLRNKSGTFPSPDSIDMKRTALLLDVDGTLLDIATTPAHVVVSESLRATLSELLTRSDGAVALVSGRTIESLDSLFAPLKTPAIGGHGAEMRLVPAEPPEKRPISISDRLRRRLHDLANIDPRLLVEDKLHSVALHYRLAKHRKPALKNEVAKIVAAEPGNNVEILLGKAVIEIKPKAFNKGTAVSKLMTHPPFAGRTPLFIGDDTTDEPVFRVLPNLAGRGYSVGRVMAGAHGKFASPQAVRTWLQRISTHGQKT